jgi:membrane protease YdiL (CAAX protease family)
MTEANPGTTDSLGAGQEPVPLPPASNGFGSVLRGPEGIRAGWRLLMYLVGFAALILAFQPFLKHIPAIAEIIRRAQKQGILTPYAEFIIEGVVITASLLPAYLMARVEKRPFGAYGIPLQGAFGKLFWQGVFWGLAFETVEMVLINVLGGYSFGTLALSGTELIKYAVLWAVGFVLVGIQEEFTFRGYTQFTLARGIGFWPSAIILSILFGAGHLSNQGEGWVGALEVAIFGIFACFTLRRTGNLWFAIGFHAAGDYAETFIYSVPDSGLAATGHLLNSSFHGPKWLTGGTVGPEASAIDFVVFLLAFILFAWLYPAKNAPTPA